MLELSRVTDALPVLAISPLLPSAFAELPYSSELLLLASFPTWVTGDAEYDAVCEEGFDAYFTALYHYNTQDASWTFIDRWYTYDEVAALVYECLTPDPDEDPLPLAVGFLHGWLSALALTDRPTALRGLALLVTSLQAVFSLTHPGYAPFQYGEPVKGIGCTYNAYGIMRVYLCGGRLQAELHRGARTDRSVTFSRLSDAERLCRVLNGEEAAQC